MLQKADIGEAAVYRRSVDRSRTFNEPQNTVRNAGQYSAVRSKQRVYKKRWTFCRLSYFQAVRTGTDCGRSPENLTNL